MQPDPFRSQEAEFSVLGGVMLDGRAFDDIADKLRAEDFYEERHQTIFAAIAALAAAGKPLDWITVSEHLNDHGELVGDLTQGALAQMVMNVPGAANVSAYAEIVREKSLRRQLFTASVDVQKAARVADGRKSDELLEEAEQRIFALRNEGSRARTGPEKLSVIWSEAMREVEQRAINGAPPPGISAGFADFDRITHGLGSGDLVIVAGRPSMGKTTWAMNIAAHVAIVRGIPTAVFSLEMGRGQLALRLASAMSGVDFDSIRAARLTDEQWSRLAEVEGDAQRAPLFIDETGRLSPLELRARARRIAARHGLGLIVVDYIQLMEIPGAENRVNEISAISRSLKALAKELNVPVMALSQLNRGVENRDNKRPRMADLRESGGIEQDADLIAFVYRDEVYNPESPDKGTAEIIIGKQRNGPLGTVRLASQLEVCRFANLAPDWARPERPSMPPPPPARGLDAFAARSDLHG